MTTETALFVKICGLRTPADIDVAVDAGADAIGIVMSEGSPRTVDLATARALIEHADHRALTVLVVKGQSAEDAAALANEARVDVLQLHGFDEQQTAAIRRSFPRVWRAASLHKNPDVHVGAHGEELLLLDSPSAGSGQRWDLSALADRRPDGPWLLAGGLDPENVEQAILEAAPWGVDVSSGVESAPGVKDHARIAAFVERARSASRRSRSDDPLD